jgi:hypothetical protein
LDDPVRDIIVSLSLFNTELNGTTPSEDVEHADAVPRSVAYAIAEIQRLLIGLDGSLIDSATRSAERRILTAWSAVLAGDIDDLVSHVEAEEDMRAEFD